MPKESSNRVSLHTEAESIRDWESVCDHIIKRSNGITMETDEFLQLFLALAATYREYKEMACKMSQIITTQKEYVEVPDYQQTAIHRGCGLVQSCLEQMHSSYTELYEYLDGICKQIACKQQEWKLFVDEIVPYTQSNKEHYLIKERQLKQSMDAYMQSAEHNDRSFFVVARDYQRTLLEFQKILKTATDSMQDVIKRVQSIECEKKKLETAIQRNFIESVLNKQAIIKKKFESSLKELEQLNGKNAWNLLTKKLNLYKADGKKTIFEDPVPNKAGALIKSWMERDMEMTANVAVNNQIKSWMIVTRWGFVQIYNSQTDIQPQSEFYVYDYQIDEDGMSQMMESELMTRLIVRQHQTWAPLQGLTMHYDIVFDDAQKKEKFDHLVGEFQATHAPQT